MKLLGVSLFILLFSTEVFAHGPVMHSAPARSNPILRFIARIKILREVALSALIEERCVRYMRNSEQGPCFATVDEEIDLLDFDILFEKDQKTPLLLDAHNPGSFVFVAFKKELIRLLSQDRTQSYLKLVNTQMTRAFHNKTTPPNLWDLTVAFYGSSFEAARALAVLFQDTSPARLHLVYLERSRTRRNSPSFENNRELLDRTIETLNMILDVNGENFHALFYPREVQEKLQRTIYHFYVPTYLSMALRRAGIREYHAFIAPLMLTVTYEFVTAAQDFRYLFEDPFRLSRHTREESWKVGDIYGAYSGVSFGLGRMTKVAPLSEVRDAFDVSTSKGMGLLTK